jgi:hypothetical protein
MPRRSTALRTALAAALAAAGACADSRGAPPPVAEFLVAAGDSTYWVSTAGGHVRVRRSPLFLARVGGRFHELYVTDAERAYEDAVFTAETMFARDILTGDSSVVLADSAVGAAAAEYAAAHPNARPLDEDEDEADDPGTVVQAEVELVDAHGPYVSYELHVDAEHAGELPTRETRRGVVDLRSGTRAGLAALFGDTAARRMAAAGERLFSAALDSVLAARDARAARAVDALGDFAFDPWSFAIADERGAPAVQFLAPGAGASAGGLTLPLPAVAAPTPTWWAEVRETLPASDTAKVSERAAERWPHGAYDVVARYDTAGDGVALALAAPGRSKGERREWPVAQVQGPVYHVYRLDRPPLDSAQAKALRRAFDESVLYDEGARTVRAPRRPARGPVVRLASYRRPAAAVSRQPSAIR